MLILYPADFQNSFISSSSFFVELFGFAIYSSIGYLISNQKCLQITNKIVIKLVHKCPKEFREHVKNDQFLKYKNIKKTKKNMTLMYRSQPNQVLILIDSERKMNI